jgi:hypothetical protein
MYFKLSFAAILFSCFLASGHAGPVQRGIPLYCSLSNGTNFWDLPSALNRYSGCRAHFVCRSGSPVNFQHKQIASYGAIPQWLWDGPSTATFSVAQQGAIMANAGTLANANRPPNTVVYVVSYFSDIVVGEPDSDYLIGANVTYASCSAGGSNR